VGSLPLRFVARKDPMNLIEDFTERALLKG
jgi:hypothetical protein